MKHIKYIIFIIAIICSTHLYSVTAQEAFRTLADWALLGEPITLSEIPGISDLVKEPLKSALFDKIIIASPDIKQTDEGFRLSGLVSLFNQMVQVTINIGDIGEAKKRAKLMSSKEDDEEWLSKVKQETKPAVKPKHTFLTKADAIKARAQQAKEKGVELAGQARDAAKQKTKQAFDTLKGLDVSVLIGFPEGIRLGELVPVFKFVDEIFQFQQLGFAIANTASYDPQWDIDINRGVTLVGAARVAGHLEQFFNKIGEGLNQFRLVGTLSPSFNLSGTYLTAELPGQLKFPGGVRSAGLRLKAMIEELQPGIPTISVAVQTGISVPVPKQDPLTFMTGLKVSPPKVSIAGWMEGMWKHPFGLPYFEIGELGIETGVDLMLLSSAYIPISDLGIRGKMGFGDKTLEVAVNVSISTQKPDILIYGNFEGGLYLQDIINVASDIVKGFSKALGKKIDLKKLTEGKIPNIGFDQVTLSLAPKDVELANKFFKKGIILKVTGNILGTRLFFDIDISEDGIRGMSSVSNINIADILEITGAGPGSGPVVSLEIDPYSLKALFMIDGAVRLKVFGSPQANATIMLMPVGGLLDVGMSFYGFGGRFKAELDITKPQASVVEGELTANVEGLEKLAKELNKLSQVILQARKPITEAKKKMSEGLHDAERKATRELLKAREQLSKAQRDLESKKKIFENAKRDLSNLKSEERALERQIAECKGNLPKEAHDGVDMEVFRQRQVAYERTVNNLIARGKTPEEAYESLIESFYKDIAREEKLTDPYRWIQSSITPSHYSTSFSKENIAHSVTNMVHRAINKGLSLREEWHLANRLEERIHDAIITTITNQLKKVLPTLSRDDLLAVRVTYDTYRSLFNQWMLDRRIQNFRAYARRILADSSIARGSVQTISDIEKKYIIPLKQALQKQLENYLNFMKNRSQYRRKK